MKKIYTFIYATVLMSIFFACKNQPSDNDNFEFSADSIFLKTFEIENIKASEAINNFEIGNDEIYRTVKPRMKFYKIKEFNISMNIRGAIFFTQEPKDMALDGELKILYIATFDNKNNIISKLRIAKIEQISDTDNLETVKITGDKIIKQTKSILLNEDGSLSEEKFIEKFEIKDSGEIKGTNNTH